jgi:ice-binding like protein
MRSNITGGIHRNVRCPFLATGITLSVALITVMSVFVLKQSNARAETTPVNLGTAATFAVLGGQTVTNTGPTVVNGDLGVSPGTSITGFPPGVVNGTIHSADATAAQAQLDLTAAYNDAATRPSTGPLPAAIGGLTFTPGVYTAPAAVGLTGTVTLDAQGDPNAVFIFQIGSALTTASASMVNLINGARACNVFWQIGSSATLGTGSSFAGNILALTSITVTTGTTVNGRTLARNGAVTLDTNTITRPPDCTPTPTPTPTTTTTTTNNNTNNHHHHAYGRQDNGTDLNLNQNDDHHTRSITHTHDRLTKAHHHQQRTHTR